MQGEILKPGEIATDGKTFFKIGTADGAIDVKVLQMEGKKRMPVADLLRGFKMSEDTKVCD